MFCKENQYLYVCVAVLCLPSDCATLFGICLIILALFDNSENNNVMSNSANMPLVCDLQPSGCSLL